MFKNPETTRYLIESILNISAILAGFFFTAISIMFSIGDSFLGRYLIKEGEYSKLFRKMLKIVGCFVLVILISIVALIWPLIAVIAFIAFGIVVISFIYYLYHFGKIMSGFLEYEREKLKNEEMEVRNKIAKTNFFEDNE